MAAAAQFGGSQPALMNGVGFIDPTTQLLLLQQHNIMSFPSRGGLTTEGMSTTNSSNARIGIATTNSGSAGLLPVDATQQFLDEIASTKRRLLDSTGDDETKTGDNDENYNADEDEEDTKPPAKRQAL